MQRIIKKSTNQLIDLYNSHNNLNNQLKLSVTALPKDEYTDA